MGLHVTKAVPLLQHVYFIAYALMFTSLRIVKYFTARRGLSIVMGCLLSWALPCHGEDYSASMHDY